MYTCSVDIATSIWDQYSYIKWNDFNIIAYMGPLMYE